MTNQQARRLLVVALALSLLIHVLIAARITWPFGPSKTAQVETVQHIRIMRVAKQPTPAPTPTPGPSVSPAPSAKPKPQGTNGTAPLHVANAQTPPPTPAVSATPSCVQNDSPAAIS